MVEQEARMKTVPAPAGPYGLVNPTSHSGMHTGIQTRHPRRSLVPPR
jgi:hypothetical protein